MKNFDNSFLCENVNLIAGIDEAGRGPLAGPVVAASVIFDKDIFIDGVTDSKKLSEKKRNELYDKIIADCLAYSVVEIDQNRIDEINILQATLLAMKISVENLKLKPCLALIDGNQKFISNIPSKTIIKGDQKSFCIAAASILAKVTRDRIMKELDNEFPQYSWAKNKGYGTKDHIEAIKSHGISQYHRKSFLTKILNN